MRAALGEALTSARTEEIGAMRSALEDNRVVGVSGAAEVGKTTLLGWMLARYSHETGRPVVQVDLDGVYSPRDLARRWLRAAELAAAGPIASSHIAALPRSMWPATTHRADHRMRELTGRLAQAFEEESARRGWGAESDVGFGIEATARLAADTEGPVILCIDHLEAPALSRALDVRDVLWHVRAMSQEHANVHVVLACRARATALAADEDAAFYEDGTWLTIDAPTPSTWRQVDDDAPFDEILPLTGGHVRSTLLLLERFTRDRRVSPRSAFRALALEHGMLTARSVQHAATLHRLGPALLVAIANDRGPYEALPDLFTRDIASAARRLELAGLIDQPRPRTWRIVNPLVAEGLREPRFPEA